MDFLIITMANLIWILYSMSEGIREGFFNYFKLLSKRKYKSEEIEINKLFNIQRFLVLLTTGGIMYWTIGLYFIPFMVCQLLMFRFFFRRTYDKTINHLKLKEILVKNEDENLPKIMDKNKNDLVLFGISAQIFIYLFFII